MFVVDFLVKGKVWKSLRVKKERYKYCFQRGKDYSGYRVEWFDVRLLRFKFQ